MEMLSATFVVAGVASSSSSSSSCSSAAYASSSRIAGCRCAVAVVDNLKLPSKGTEFPGGRRSGVFASMLTDFCTISGPLAWW